MRTRHEHLRDVRGSIDSTGTTGLLAQARAGEGEARTELDKRHHAEMARIADAITGAMPRAIPPG